MIMQTEVNPKRSQLQVAYMSCCIESMVAISVWFIIEDTSIANMVLASTSRLGVAEIGESAVSSFRCGCASRLP